MTRSVCTFMACEYSEFTQDLLKSWEHAPTLDRDLPILCLLLRLEDILVCKGCTENDVQYIRNDIKRVPVWNFLLRFQQWKIIQKS